eukprot:9141324-Alexandrium_andersonii.AAC.1
MPHFRTPHVMQILTDGSMTAHRFPGSRLGTDVVCIVGSPLPEITSCSRQHGRDMRLIEDVFVRDEPRLPAP